MIELETILESLTSSKVEFVIVGGVAITAHGSAISNQRLRYLLFQNKRKFRQI